MSRYYSMNFIAFVLFFVGSLGLPKTCQECVKTKGAVWQVDRKEESRVSVHCAKASECEDTFEAYHTRVCKTDCDNFPDDGDGDWTKENDYIRGEECLMYYPVRICMIGTRCYSADIGGRGRCEYKELVQTLGTKVLCPREAGSPCQACIANGKIWKVHLDNGTYDLECVDECTEKFSKSEQVYCITNNCYSLRHTKEIDWTVYATKKKYTQCSINLPTIHDCVKDPECALVDNDGDNYCTFKQIAHYFNKTDLCPGGIPPFLDDIPLSMESLSTKGDDPLPVEIPSLQGEDPLYPTCQLCSEAKGMAWHIEIIDNRVIIQCQPVENCQKKVSPGYISFCVENCDKLPRPDTVIWTERGIYTDHMCTSNSTVQQCMRADHNVDTNECSWADLGTGGVCSYTTILKQLGSKIICPFKYNTDCQQCTEKGKFWQISLSTVLETKCVEDCTEKNSASENVLCFTKSQCDSLKPTKEVRFWTEETKVDIKQCSSDLAEGLCVADEDCTIVSEDSPEAYCTFKQISDYFHRDDLCSLKKETSVF